MKVVKIHTIKNDNPFLTPLNTSFSDCELKHSITAALRSNGIALNAVAENFDNAVDVFNDGNCTEDNINKIAELYDNYGTICITLARIKNEVYKYHEVEIPYLVYTQIIYRIKELENQLCQFNDNLISFLMTLASVISL